MIGVFVLLTAIALGIWGLWLIWKEPAAEKGETPGQGAGTAMDDDYIMDKLREFFRANAQSEPPASDTPTQEAPGEEPHGD